MISGFYCEVHKICALLGCFTASSDNSLPAFQDDLSIPSSRVKNPRRKPVTLIHGKTTFGENGYNLKQLQCALKLVVRTLKLKDMPTLVTLLPLCPDDKQLPQQNAGQTQHK
jgi:hypothetical protein